MINRAVRLNFCLNEKKSEKRDIVEVVHCVAGGEVILRGNVKRLYYYPLSVLQTICADLIFEKKKRKI